MMRARSWWRCHDVTAACIRSMEGASATTRRCARRFTSSSNVGSGRDDALHASSALRHQLEFCCLVSGWDTPCTSCPFQWFGFDPKERYRVLRRTPGSRADVERALELLGMELTVARGEGGAVRLCEKALKAAFRRKALEWHPDCNAEPDAETTFRDILDAYEFLRAMLPQP